VQAFGHPEGADPENFHLVAPWSHDPRQWLKMAWTDRYSGRRFRITASGQTGGEGTARVKTYADVLAEYRVHPEPKSFGPDAEPCGRQTRGLLSRRPVTAAYITYIGKESNKLDDRQAGLIHDNEEVLNEYPDPRRDPFRTLVLPVLRDCPTKEIVEGVRLDPTACPFPALLIKLHFWRSPQNGPGTPCGTGAFTRRPMTWPAARPTWKQRHNGAGTSAVPAKDHSHDFALATVAPLANSVLITDEIAKGVG
jgi:hypothetical protein